MPPTPSENRGRFGPSRNHKPCRLEVVTCMTLSAPYMRNQNLWVPGGGGALWVGSWFGAADGTKR